MPDHTMRYLESDIPAGLTIAEWRRARATGQPARTRRRLRRPRLALA
jgi:hypothetical protein